MKKDPCEFCDGVVEEAVKRIPFRYRREVVYVDNVPVRACNKCGELYIAAPVYKRLEKIAQGRKSIRTTIAFPLADYRKAEMLENR